MPEQAPTIREFSVKDSHGGEWTVKANCFRTPCYSPGVVAFIIDGQDIARFLNPIAVVEQRPNDQSI